MKTEMIAEKIDEISCIADAIRTIAFCLEQSSVDLERDNRKHDVFLGIKKLGEVLGKELDTLAQDIQQ